MKTYFLYILYIAVSYGNMIDYMPIFHSRIVIMTIFVKMTMTNLCFIYVLIIMCKFVAASLSRYIIIDQLSIGHCVFHTNILHTLYFLCYATVGMIDHKPLLSKCFVCELCVWAILDFTFVYMTAHFLPFLMPYHLKNHYRERHIIFQ